jgi:hypothetical protein
MIPTGFSPDALINGQGDAYFCYVTNQPTMLEKMGLKRDQDFYVTRIYDLGYHVLSSLLFVERRFLDRNRPSSSASSKLCFALAPRTRET